jgi:hypothetical protein
VNKNMLQLTDGLIVSATNDSIISLIYHQSGKDAICFTLKEQSLTYSFYRFFEYLKSSDFILSKYETLEVLKKQLGIFSEELNITKTIEP